LQQLRLSCLIPLWRKKSLRRAKI